MNKSLLSLFLLVIFSTAGAQVVSMPYLLTTVSVSDSRCENLVCQKGFVKTESNVEKETQVTSYFFKGKNKRDKRAEQPRKLTRYSAPFDITVKYETACPVEFKLLNEQIAEAEFWLEGTANNKKIYQFRDTEIATQVKISEDTTYEVTVQRKLLPAPRSLHYAEDLLLFNSHENLLFVFGENNVKKDRYYFSDNEFSPCTVLYPNTARQAVFIWKDEKNLRQLSQVIIGGQLMTESSFGLTDPVPQNTWQLESGVRIGMSLQELRKLNKNEVSFFGGQSQYAGKIIPAEQGEIDFKSNEIVLACLSCHDKIFMKKSQLTGDEALKDGGSFFIFSIILNAETDI